MRFTNPVPQFWLDNGTVASSGKIYFFENKNYSAMKATYSQPDNTTPNTNPVILDGQGRMPSCFGDGLYSVKFYSADGSLQWTRDDVSLSAETGQMELWLPAVRYTINDIVKDSINGEYYQLYGATSSIGNQPSTSLNLWQKIVFITEHNTNKTYSIDNIVKSGGFLYRSLQNNNTDTPPSAKWANLTFNDSVAGDFNVGGNLNSETITVSNTESADADKLDWYLETASFVPVVRGSSSAGVGGYTSQEGKATRIGNVVFFSLGVGWSTHSGTGDIIITGLPYPSASSGPIAAISVNYSTLSVGGASYQLGGRIFNGVSQLSLTRSLNDGSGVASGVPMDTAAGLSISGFYFTN